MLVHLLNVTIERDTMTQTVVSVPFHEIAILQAVHGFERVIVDDEPQGTFNIGDIGTEIERLQFKYGNDSNGKPVVSAVYPNQRDFQARIEEGAVVEKKTRGTKATKEEV